MLLEINIVEFVVEVLVELLVEVLVESFDEVLVELFDEVFVEFVVLLLVTLFTTTTSLGT